MGENVYEDRDPAQRARELLADDMLELEQMIARREEMMCRDAIFTLNGNRLGDVTRDRARTTAPRSTSPVSPGSSWRR
jgi:hypothetical protein